LPSGTRWRNVLLPVAFVALLIQSPSALALPRPTEAAATFYVSTIGDDSNAGSLSAPWRTIQHALDVVQPGHQVLVRGGIYNEFIEFRSSGNLDAPIILSGYQGESAILAGTGLNWRYGINLGSFDNLIVQGLTIRDYIRDGERGFGIVGWGDTDNIILRNLDISLVGTPVKIAGDSDVLDVRSGIIIENVAAAEYEWGGIDLGPGPVSNVIIRNVHLIGQQGTDDTSIDGIAVESGNQILVENATVRGHAGDGVDLKADNAVVRQVDARGYGRNGLKLWGAGSSAENSLFTGGQLEALVVKTGPCSILNTLFSIAPGHGYTAVIGPYEPPPGTPTTPVTLRGNIFYTTENTGSLIYFSPVVQIVTDYNLYYSPGSSDAVLEAYPGGVQRTFSAADVNDGTWSSTIQTDQHSKYGDPLLVNPGAEDYRLRAGSPAIDAIPTSLAPSVDLEGKPRPQGSGADIGPYELVPATQTSFDFFLISSGGIAIMQGNNGSNTITAILFTSSAGTVTLSCTSDLPAGASCSFNPTSGSPTFSSTLTIAAISTTPKGSFPITVAGTNGGLTRTTQFTLTVFAGTPITSALTESISHTETISAPTSQTQAELDSNWYLMVVLLVLGSVAALSFGRVLSSRNRRRTPRRASPFSVSSAEAETHCLKRPEDL